MPPRIPKPTTSQAIVSTGPKEVIVHPSKLKQKGPVEKQTTTRALVLRNGKYGAMGSGEVMLMAKMTGKEKLDLLAEDLIKKSKTAIATPFRLEKCLKIAESQYDVYLDDIAALKDPELFRHIIEAELNSRTRPGTEPRRNATHVAKVVTTRIHNSYMLASAWKIVSETLNGLAHEGITDRNIKMKLKNNVEFREHYLILYDLVNTLVEMSHVRVSVLATCTPHYAPCFKPKPAELCAPGEEEMIFDWQSRNLRSVTESFLDSIIIELCFPHAPFPRAIMYELLKEAIEESPREAKRFPQSTWDAIGDLAESVELQTLVEAALLGPDSQAWKNQPRTMPEEYEQWVDAQIFSEKASSQITNWKDAIYPLNATRRTEVLEAMWKTINLNYQNVSGHDIDTLWQLEGELNSTPQWTPYFIASLADIDSEDEGEGPPGLIMDGKKQKKKPLAIAEDAYNSDHSMPGLQSVSNTSSEEEADDDDDEQEVEEEEDSGGSGYNTEEEDEVRDLLREAMDAGHEADWLDTSNSVPADMDPLNADDRKGNPFLKLLGSLRGRMFSSNPKLKVAPRTEPRPGVRRAFRATPSGAPKSVPSGAPPKPAPPPAKSATVKQPEVTQSHKPTIEEVEDEDATTKPKKKKKKPKKKKPSTVSPDLQNSPPPASTNNVHAPPSPAKSPIIPQTPASPAKKAPATAQGSPLRPSLTRSSVSQVSTSTSDIPVETKTAQSAHAYLRSLDSDVQKTKIKSRPDHASLFSNSEKEKEKPSRGFFSKLARGFKDKEGPGVTTTKYVWFSNLTKKTTDYMHQLLRTSEDANNPLGSMKWEHFVKLMREMGFDYDPSTAGSSVRFDPPNKNDKPISIHKPHPDSTLTPIMLRKIGKRLMRRYGWNEDDFLKQTAAASA